MSIHPFKLHLSAGRMSNSGGASSPSGLSQGRCGFWKVESPHLDWAGCTAGPERKESGTRCSHRSVEPAGLSPEPSDPCLLLGLQALRTSGPLSDLLAPELLTQASFSMQAA